MPLTGAEARQRRKRFITWGLLGMSGVLMVNALIGDRGYLDTIRARQDYIAVVRSLTDLRLENARLKEEARRLREDPAAIEEAARRDLGLIKQGETIVILKDSKK